MCGLGCTKFFNVVLSLAGIGISAFALWIEIQGEEDDSYKPPCDLEENISCSVMFNSQYGTGFGLVHKFLGARHPANQPNNVYGAIFSAFFFLLYCLTTSSLPLFRFY